MTQIKEIGSKNFFSSEIKNARSPNSWHLILVLFFTSCATVTYDQAELPFENIAAAQSQIASTKFAELKDKDSEAINKIFSEVVNALNTSAHDFCEIYSEQDLCEWNYRLEENKIFNAYASGKNDITILTGLINGIEESEELAFVVAHELGHHIANHISESSRNILLGQLAGAVIGAAVYGSEGTSEDINQIANLGGSIGRLRFSRAQENEADLIGIAILIKAGLDLSKAEKVIVRMAQEDSREKRSSFLDTHPSSPERLAYFKLNKDRILNGELFPFIN
jgi:Zn-dependent protease with chaperone function